MASGASIVVDIKAQITGYKEQIENIKNELKKVDPGSQIGKSLNRTLEQADQKLSKLSRNAEERITSQSQLDRLFDQLHSVSDLMRNLGQGMQSVGLNDVLLTSSEQARQLGQELKTVQDEMKTKGTNFFEEITKTNPKELSAVFDQLKLDPKKTGINEFVNALDEAVNQGKQKIEELTKAQEQAKSEAEVAAKTATLRAQLPSELAGTTKVTQTFMRQALGSDKFLSQSQADATSMATEFLNQIRTGLDVDNPEKGTDRNNALKEALEKTATGLTKAKDEASVQKVLNALQAAINQHTQKDVGGAKTISELTGGIDLNEWAEKLTAKAEVDKDFETKIRSLISVFTDDTASAEMQTSGAKLSQALENLLDPNATTTFKSRMDEVIKIATEGMKQLNDTTKIAGDPTQKQVILQGITDDLEKTKSDLTQLESIKNTPAYQEIQGIVNNLNTRIASIEQKLGIENNRNAAGVASDINEKGKQLSATLPVIDQGATDQLKQYTTALEEAQRRQQMMSKVEGIAQRWFSVYAAVRMVSKAFRSMKENVTKIDNTITEIAIVTDMSQSDLWRQMPQYTAMARKYGSTIEGVYQVSQLYYQQGLEQADVMELTEQTLKMARISGLDYSDATNYMTNAIRSFKMEMQDAQTVVDVYSALAASSASSTTELATAMSKTASSAAAVGASFESTSAMMAVMIETTRESPENIGSALKSIISRYGELKENKTGIDEEGEEYSLNKVDTALQSVGISIHDAQGQFRDFDDVIMELAQSWDTIDTNTQRYIATVMAGNRQQSRFLALVSNGERLAELTETAENSEDASTLQVLKTMDSIAYKSQNLQTSLQSLYTDSGIENLYKGILDGANEVVKTFTDMPTLFQLPIPALASFAMNFISIANVVLTAIQVLKRKFMAQWETDDLTSAIKKRVQQEELVNGEKLTQERITQIRQEESAKRQNIDQKENGTAKGGKLNKTSKAVLGMQVAGTALSLGAGLISDKGIGNRAAKAGMGITGSALDYAAMGTMIAPGWGTAIGAVAGGLMGLWQNISYIWESTSDQAKRLNEEAETVKTEYQQKKATASNAEKEIANVKKLAEAQYDSVEAREKYIEAANKLATDMPELVNYYDAEGNAILDLSNAYTILAEKRREANDASNESAEASLSAANKAIEEKQEAVDKVVTEGITKSIDFGSLKGTAKDKWQAVKATDNIMGWAQAAELGGGKGNDLSGIIQIANEKLLGNMPGLKQLYSLLVADDGAGIRNLIETPDKRDTMFKQWNQELSQITDPASKAAIDFVLYQLQGISTELTSAFGELNQATARRTQTIHSNAAEYVNNFIADTRTMAEYGPNGEEKTQAKEMLEMFKDLDNSSEIVTNYLTQQFLANSDKYKTWDDFVKDLEDPEKSPLLNFLNVLNQVPETLYTELNDLLQHQSQYTKEVMQQKIAALLGNDDLAQAIIDTYSNYYDNLIDAKEFKKQINKQTDATYFKTTKFFENGDTFDFLPTLSGEEMSTILDMKDRIESMYSSGRITKLDARKFMNAYSDLWGTGDEAIQGILSRITDFSAESLEELYTLIDNSDEFTSDEQKETFKQSLATLFGFIPQNLNTSLKSYEEQMVTTAKDYSKDMSSATKGMDYEAASELAKKLNIDTGTEYFDVREGELFLKNTSLIYDHYFGKEGISTLLTSKMHEYSENLNQHIESLNQLNLKDLDEETLTQEQAEKYGVDLVTLKQVVKDFKQSGLDTITDEWISNYFEGTITNTEDLVNTFFKSDDLTRAIDSGKLEDIIKAGFISDAPKFMIESYMGTLKDALQSGDFSRITEEAFFSKEFKSKLPELKQTYDDAQSSVIDDMISGLDEGFSYIEGTEFNKELLSDLKSKGLAELTPAVNGVSNAIITASRDQVLTYLEGITDASQVGMTTSELREKIASLRADKYEKSNMGTLQTILDNYDNIDEVAYQNLLDHWDFADISAIFTRRADGTYKANLPKLVKAYRNGSIQLDDLTQEKMNEVVTKAIDDGMSSITSAADYTTKGTTKFQDMADFIKAFNEAIPGINAEITDLFSYDKDLQGYTLDTTSYRTYLEAQKQLLISLGEDTEYIDGIIENANKSIIDAIDVKSFMEAEQKGTKEAPSKAREALIKQLKNANIWESGVVEKSEDWRDYYAAAADAVSLGADKFTAEGAAKALANEAKKWNDNIRTEAANHFIEQIENGGSGAVMALHALATVQDKELTSEEIESAYLSQVQQLEDAFDQLEYGIGSIVNGEAVTALKNAGYNLTQLGGGNAVIDSIGDISKAYENYYNALKETNVATVAALNEAYAKVLETKDGKAAEQNAIEALGDASGMTYTTLGAILSDAGMSLEDNLENLSDIIESTGGNKIRIKDFAAFARRMNWDYDSEEYTSAFKSYNDSLIERNKQVEKSVNEEIQGLSDIKPGDWLNLTQTEKALKKAGKDNSKEIAQNSKELLKAQRNNDQEAIEHWQSEIDKLYSDDTINQLNNVLLQYGATLSDGILRLADDANLIGIAQTLQTAVGDAGIDIADDVKDMIQNIMDAYSDLIIKGIEGSLTNIEKSDLKKKAADIGVDLSDNDFVQGAEGFELSMNKSIALWSKWGQINNQQQKKIYKTLTQQLKDNNSNYKTTTKMLSHLIDMQDELNELKDHETDKNKGQIEQLENEIKLLKEMQMYSLTHEDSSWNFMSNDAIPDSIDNALNYFANWKTLESQLNTWAGSNVSELDGFAAGLKHIQEVADATGGQFTYMGKEITAGGDAYGKFLDHISEIRTWDDKSKSWALSNKALKDILGFDMSLGSKGISKELRNNVDQYVQYNADLLKEFDEFTGGLAEVYKTLHDYSDADNGHSFDDFLINQGSEDEKFDYNKFITQLDKRKGALDAFKQFTDQISFGEQSWDEAVASGNFEKGSQNYQAMMAVMKMALSENWDLESDYQAIADQLSQSGFNGEVTLGDIVITAIDGATIIKKKENGEDVFIDPDGNPHSTLNDAKDAINRKAVEQYQKELGKYSKSTDNNYEIEIAGTTLTYIIKNGQIKVVNENGEHVVTGDSVTDVNTQLQDYYANQDSDIGRVAKSISEEAWSSYISPQYKNAETFTGGQISSQARAKMQAGGLTTAQSIADAYNAAVESVSKKSGVNKNANEFLTNYSDAIQTEMYASTGLKVDVSKWDVQVTGQDGLVKEISDQVNMTQTAVDVMNGITQAFTGTSGQQIGEVLSSAIAGAFTQKEIPISEIKVSPQLVSVDGDSVTVAEIPSGTGTITNLKVKATTVEADGTISAAEITAELDGQTISVKIDKNGAQGDIDAIKKAIQALSPQKVTVEIPAPSTSPITDAINGLGVQTVDVKLNPIIGGIFGMLFGGGTATGNIGLANAKGTLMGELGPELVVSGGRYFVVGQSGPEMVNLADDAIVFNHLQTKSLLEKGSSSTRGRAITNERNAIAYATGSIHGGHAMPDGTGNIVDVNNKYRGAGSVWEAGFNAAKTAKKPDDDKALKSFLKELERWYNWLQKIAYLEKEISYQEALRSKYQSDFTRTGAEYYDSQIKTLGLLKDQIAIQEDLVKEQRKFLEQRKAELANSPLSTVYTFDEKGQLVYQEGMYENFSKLFGTNDQGIPYYTAEEQYDALKAMHMEEFMKYDSSGQEIDQNKDGWKATAVQAFADKMEKERDEIQRLIDDTLDGETKLLELQTNQNQILQDIEDNQISVEQKVLKAIEDSRQREIDELQKERDAIEKGNQKLIEGLNQQLQKEQDLYNRQQDADELSKLQRQLAIAQRSGGSAATIADLQRQITEKQKDIYFETQQAEIDALQEASDNEIERLDNQIQLMEETLAYEKEHGLLWQEVRGILSQDAESIMAFIKGNTTEYWGKSTAELQKVIRQDLFEVDRFKKFQEDTTNGIQDLVNKFVTNDNEKKEPESVAPTEQTPAANTGESTGGSGGSGSDVNDKNSPNNNSTNTTWVYDDKVSGKMWEVGANGKTTGNIKYDDAGLPDTSTKKGQQKFENAIEAGRERELARKEAAAEEAQEAYDAIIVTGVESAIKKTEAGKALKKANEDVDSAKDLANEGYYKWIKEEKGIQTQRIADLYDWLYKPEYKESKKVASGGYVNHGFYELGERGIETVLTASQTKVLRDNILSNRPDSLINLLKSYNEAYHGLSKATYDSISNNSTNTTIIERAEVNLHIDKLANDYDSKRAANTIMDEMLRIASKTSANNSVRR